MDKEHKQMDIEYSYLICKCYLYIFHYYLFICFV